MKRLFWVQLGVPDAEFSYRENNIPTAAGYVLAHLARHGGLEGISAEILAPSLADCAGDARLLDECLSRGPDVLCLTCQAWNVERSLHLAGQVKAHRPGVKVIAGGPEITPDCCWLDRPEVDAFVFGEGETGLPLALQRLAEEGPRPLQVDAPPLDTLAGAGDPYSAGFLQPGPQHNCLLETTRGCAQRCSYCNYSKRSPRVRRHEPAALEAFFRWATTQEVADVYLLDPSFGADPALAERLADLARWNPRPIPLHSETRLEGITPARAAAFFQAGFRSVEVGLQSIHVAPCRSVNRKLDLAGFEAGARAMREAGVALEVGIILGLPKDSLNGFRSTLEWLAAHDLGDAAEIFHLSLLPGTALRETARARRWRFMPKPPYYLLSGAGWDEASLLQGVYEVEDTLDRGHFLDIPPWFEASPAPDLITRERVDLRADPEAAVDRALGGRRQWAAVLTLELVFDRFTQPVSAALTRLAQVALESNPYGIYRLVLRTAQPATEENIQAIREAFTLGDQYWNRVNHFRDDPSGVFSCRVFQVAPPGRHGEFVRRLAESADVVFELPPTGEAYESLATTVEAAGLPGQLYAAAAGAPPEVVDHCRRRDVEERRVFLRLLAPPA